MGLASFKDFFCFFLQPFPVFYRLSYIITLIETLTTTLIIT
jgi:hypothetical protein